jgi:hypothetical protein
MLQGVARLVRARRQEAASSQPALASAPARGRSVSPEVDSSRSPLPTGERMSRDYPDLPAACPLIGGVQPPDVAL